MSQIPRLSNEMLYGKDRKKLRHAPFSRLLSIIKHREDIGERPQYFEKETLPLMQQMDTQELTQQNSILLITATNKALPHTVEYLMQITDKWPKEIIQSCLINASKQGYDHTVESLLNNTEHWDSQLFNKLYNQAKDSEMRSTLNNFKKNKLGKNWRTTEEYEIERKNNDMRQIFNFAACHVTTIIKDKVIQRNFSEFQSDGEITIAYEKLNIFSNNAPAYNGKNTRSNRRITRTNKP